ncbi:MAG: hypothetical protein OHK0039_42600 [Bacteroidia bacterium]
MKRRIIWGAALLLVCAGWTGCGRELPLANQPTELPLGSEDQLRAVRFVGQDTGYVAGGQRFLNDVLFRTTDGGATWERQYTVQPLGKIVFDLDFLDGSRGFAAALDGKVLLTTDGGQHWQIRQIPYWKPLQAVQAVNDTLVVAVGGSGYDDGMIVRSADGGQTWAVIDTPRRELRDVWFTHPDTGFACGYGAIYKSTDGGRRWAFTSASDEFFTSLHFLSGRLGYAVGRTGSIVRTRDGGVTWETLRNGNLPWMPLHRYNQICMLDARTGYIVGDAGLVLKTTDGGKTWLRFERQIPADLMQIHLFGEGDGLLAGRDGRLYRLLE